MLKFDHLRQKHPIFTYHSYVWKIKDSFITFEFQFELNDSHTFRPTISIPIHGSLNSIDNASINFLAFHLGMFELISYWKTACSPQIIIKAGSLNQFENKFYTTLFINGLGEFFVTNQIDFTQDNLFKFNGTGPTHTYNNHTLNLNQDYLILVGGGKDSCVSLDILSTTPVSKRQVLLLNPTSAARSITKIAGYNNPIIVRRTIDPTLTKLNQQGYLNGHTPFSAYLSIIATIVSLLYGFKTIITSNEQSANEGNVSWHGLTANHQYSKTFDYESDFNTFINNSHIPINYISLLRPLYEIKIAQLFSSLESYHNHFKSCNLGSKQNTWCGTCSKCLFTFLILSPFMPYSKLTTIYNKDMLNDKTLLSTFKAIIGETDYKPFDCVGTLKESKAATSILLANRQNNNQPIPNLLKLTKPLLNKSTKQKNTFNHLLNHFDSNHLLDIKLETLLKQYLNNHNT